MSRRNKRFGPGDPVFHPRFGLGTVHGLIRRERIYPVGERVIASAGSEKTEECYDIDLVEGGSLQVPVRRAESVGLRQAWNGIQEIEASLRSSAEELPAEARERAAELRAREQLIEPEALACTVRDLLAQSRGRTLSTGERAWLDKACHRLSEEAALVDRISELEARSAIWQVVSELRTA
jgi:RNA polymerase-interacting CarD/CdnL/TRCF family regulator